MRVYVYFVSLYTYTLSSGIRAITTPSTKTCSQGIFRSRLPHPLALEAIEAGVAIQVARDVRSRRAGTTAIRLVVHEGQVKVGPDGDPLGEEGYRLFRLEAITEDDRLPGRAPESPRPIPDDGRIVITRPAVDAGPGPWPSRRRGSASMRLGLERVPSVSSASRCATFAQHYTHRA